MRISIYTSYLALPLVYLIVGINSRAVESSLQNYNPDFGAIDVAGGDLAKISLASHVAELENLASRDVHCFDGKSKNRKKARSDQLEQRADSPADLLLTEQARVVAMAMVSYAPWAELEFGIGTVGLCGCTAIAIFGRTGALFAHLSPSYNTIDSQLEAIRAYMQESFAGEDHTSITALIMPPAQDGTDVSWFLTTVITDFFVHSLSLPSVRVTYNMLPEGSGRDGTILLRMFAGIGARVWINNQIAWRANSEKY